MRRLAGWLSCRRWQRWAVAAVLTGLFLVPFIRVLRRVGDEGTIVYGAQRVVQGALPYRDFFEVMGPGSFWWLGLFFHLFGVSFFVARTQLLLTGVCTAVLVYWIARKTTPGPGDWWPAVMVTVASIPLWPATSHHWDSNLFFLTGVALFLVSRVGERRACLLTSGIAAGLTACFMPEKGAYLAVALALTLTMAPGAGRLRSRLVKCALFLAASAAPILAVAVFYAAQGQLGTLVDATLLWPLSHYAGANAMPYAKWAGALSAGNSSRTLSCLPDQLRLALALATLPAAMILVAAPAAVVLLGFLAYRHGRLSAKLLDSALPVSLTAAALYISEMHRPDFYHLVYGAPLLLVGLVLFGRAAFPSRVANRAFWLVMTAPVLVWGGALLIGAMHANVRVETRRGAVFVEKRDEALDALLSTAAPGSRVFVYPYYPMYYFLADLENPTRYTILLYGYNTSAQFQEAADALVMGHVDLVLSDTVVSGDNLSTWFPGYRHPSSDDMVIERVFDARYEEYSRKGGWKFLRWRGTASRPSVVQAWQLPSLVPKTAY